jgi:UDP-N-acetyl-2-amino-2-deoxyglucuronate dehydrogenase
MKKTFAIVGVAGYIAPKHLQAIKDVGGQLVFAMDISDSVGILDSYFDDCLFTTKENIFKRYLRKDNIDYLVICTPNYLHYHFIKMGLKYCKQIICEKPLVIKKRHLNNLMKYDKRINCIMQLRLSKVVKDIKEAVKLVTKLDIEYLVKRGDWYFKSWKAEKKKSGGILFNIGIHALDLIYSLEIDIDVNYKLKIGKKQKKIIKIGKMVFDLSKGFTDLHTESYKKILKGKGFHVKDVLPVMNYLYEC